MKKNLKKISMVMALALGVAALGGCGKKEDKVDVQGMIDKYSAYCELGEYKGVEYTMTKTEVTDVMVEYEMQNIVVKNGTTEKLTEGKAVDGDTVNIDFVGKIDGVAFDGGSTDGEGYSIQLGSNRLIDDFEEQIVGHKCGETFNVVVTFPKDYGQDDLNGKEAIFETTLNYIERTSYPELTDALVASDADADCDTVEEYKEKTRKELEEQYAESDDSYNKSAVITVVMDNSKITTYPEQELQTLIDDAISSVQAEAASYNYDLATYVTARYGMKSEADFREYIATLAENYLKEKILICAIAKAEGVTVSSDDIEAEKTYMIEQLGYKDEKELKEHYTTEDIVYYAISDKVYDILLENGKGVEKPASSTDATASKTDATASDASKSDAE